MFNLNYTPTTLGGYKLEDKLYLGVREQKRLNTAGVEPVFYFCFRLHISWYRYTIRFSISTCFCLIGPSSDTLGLTITYFFSCYSPYNGDCLHIGSGLYTFYVMPCVAKRIEYLK
jgi:hypothetical protein